jgi:hypothetical protein
VKEVGVGSAGTFTSPRGQKIIELSAHKNVLDHAILTELREFDRNREWERDGATSCAAWLGWKLGTPPKTAQQRVRVARALGELPIIDDAMRRGLLSYTQVRALTRIATPENEADLLQLAQNTAGGQLEKICRFIRDRVAADEGVIPEQALRLGFETFSDGSQELRVRLRPEQALGMRKKVRAVKELSGDPTMSDADALVALTDRGAGPVDEPKSVASRAELLLVVDEAALREAERPADARCELEDGTPISAETARRLTCDSPVRKVKLAPDGTPLDVGRRTRRVSKRLWKALLLRDGGCAFPGCTHRAFLDAHHIEHWARGGKTTKENLTLVCTKHHRYVHELGFRVVASAAGPLFYAPSGELLTHGVSLPDLSLGGGNPIERAMRETASRGFQFSSELRHMWSVPHLRRSFNIAARVALDRLRVRRGA